MYQHSGELLWVNKWQSFHRHCVTQVQGLAHCQKLSKPDISRVMRKENEKWCKRNWNVGFKDTHISSLECAGCSGWDQSGQASKIFLNENLNSKQTHAATGDSEAWDAGLSSHKRRKVRGASCSHLPWGGGEGSAYVKLTVCLEELWCAGGPQIIHPTNAALSALRCTCWWRAGTFGAAASFVSPIAPSNNFLIIFTEVC